MQTRQNRPLDKFMLFLLMQSSVQFIVTKDGAIKIHATDALLA